MFKQTFLTTRNRGPKILVISGIHGDETQAVKAVLKLAEEISKSVNSPASALSKVTSYTFLHGVNDYGLLTHQRENTFQKETAPSQNLNCLFTPTYQTPQEVKDLITPEIEAADIVIDVHNSPVCKNCFLVDYDSYAEKCLSLTKKTTLTPLLRVANVNAGTVKNKALSLGKIGFTVELNGMGFLGSDPDRGATLLQDFLISIIDSYEKPVTPLDKLEDYLSVFLFSKISGILEWKRLDPLMKKYSKGETICTVTSLNGKEVQEIKAPFSGGFVYDIPDSLYISKGEPFIEYAKNPQELFNKA